MESKEKKTILKVEGLTRDYVKTDGEKKGSQEVINVLKGLDFAVKQQEFVGIIGRSGCGKTTLLKVLGMIDTPTGGKVYFKDNDT